MTPGRPQDLDVHAIRAQFPALEQEIHGRPLVFLDNAASTQKPRAVLDAIQSLYSRDYANVHRGVHTLSVRATERYEAARASVQRFLNAPDLASCIFTSGTTEAINLIAQAWGGANVGPGDELLITHMEHHSNIVPWQMLCEATGATLRVAAINERGELDRGDFTCKLSERTKLVSVVHVSNALGTVNPIRELVAEAHAVGALVLVDGAQAAPHEPIDVQALGCDFYALSGHKVYGPTGIGVLWGRYDLLDAMRPWQGGGDMIESVSFSGTTYAGLPSRLEAGTPHIAGAVGLGAAVEWMMDIGVEAIRAHELCLLHRATVINIKGDSYRMREKRQAGLFPGTVALDPTLKGTTPTTKTKPSRR